MVRLPIQVHTAAVHEFSVASDRLKGTSDNNEGTECQQSRMPTLAHCYETDKSQPGKNWYSRSLAFHELCCQ
jgi:hypothetical protein